MQRVVSYNIPTASSGACRFSLATAGTALTAAVPPA
jgi:hypothetical protein